ncbi:MAG: SDR family NAD(P)-dependent oxidoreductase [bacterium]|jgi:3-oxoacyl-[acyl-carrier protein] reductase
MKVLITGASKGIGRGIATVLAQEGFEVGLMARSINLLQELQKELTTQGCTCAVEEVDLRNVESTSNAVKVLIRKLGGVDALINNAGVVIRKNIFDLSLEEWHTMMETNINGVYYATRAVLPYLKEQRKGVIINISSISGKVPLAGGSAYAASKYAVTGFSQSLFQEVRDSGIKVATIYPGSVDSESHRHDPNEDHSWKVRPEDVGYACRQILTTSDPTCISELEIRPLARPSKK